MNEKLEFKYKEMVRLSEKLDEYAKSSFEDFKMLSAIGALIAWKPIVEVMSKNSADNVKVLLIGFLAILVVSALIGMFGLLKQAVVNFYFQEIEKFEREVRIELSDTDTTTFHVAENWINKGKKKQRRVALRFYALFYMVLIVYPTAILTSDRTPLCAAVYFFSAICMLLLHLSTARLVHEND